MKAPETCNFNKKRLQLRCFPENFAKFLRITFFTEHHRTTASGLFHSFKGALMQILKLYYMFESI